jgi:phosphatidylinositol glycan class A protein
VVLILTQVLSRGHIFLNTSLTESFGIALLEAACAGLLVVATAVGGVPEVLPPSYAILARPTSDAILNALAMAVKRVKDGKHNPHATHERVRGLYGWADVALRKEKVYAAALQKPMTTFWERWQRCDSRVYAHMHV